MVCARHEVSIRLHSGVSKSALYRKEFGVEVETQSQGVVIVEAAEGATTIRRPDPEELAAWLEDYSLGELLRLGHLEET